MALRNIFVQSTSWAIPLLDDDGGGDETRWLLSHGRIPRCGGRGVPISIVRFLPSQFMTYVPPGSSTENHPRIPSPRAPRKSRATAERSLVGFQKHKLRHPLIRHGPVIETDTGCRSMGRDPRGVTFSTLSGNRTSGGNDWNIRSTQRSVANRWHNACSIIWIWTTVRCAIPSVTSSRSNVGEDDNTKEWCKTSWISSLELKYYSIETTTLILPNSREVNFKSGELPTSPYDDGLQNS